MPIYEYRCRDCRKEMSILFLSAGSAHEPTCKYCGSRQLSQLISRFSVPLSEENRLERLADPGHLGDLDENDPQSMARFMKRMGKELGEDMGVDIDQAVEEAMAEETGDGTADRQGPPVRRGAGEW